MIPTGDDFAEFECMPAARAVEPAAASRNVRPRVGEAFHVGHGDVTGRFVQRQSDRLLQFGVGYLDDLGVGGWDQGLETERECQGDEDSGEAGGEALCAGTAN